ncbi:MAG: DUF3421 domain-containing protein [Acidobacteria bacterium]|nr:DUF3421 domain-containing protein [Acidobacteriota bacterium]
MFNMFTRTFTAAFVLCLASAAFAQPEVQAIYARGQEHFKAKRWDDAIREYTEVLRLRSDVSGVYYSRGLCYLNKRVGEPKRTYQQEAAITANLKPGEKPPKSQNSLNAIADFTRSIELQPGAPSFASYYSRAQVYKLENDLEPAIVDLQKFIEVHPAFEQHPQFSTAKVQLTAIGNDYAQSLVTRGLYEIVMLSYSTVRGDKRTPEEIREDDERDRAIKDLFRKAVKYYQPVNSYSYAGRARARLQLDDFAGAVGDFKEAVKFTPNDASLIGDLANAYKRNKQLDLAVAEYGKIIAMPEAHSSVKIAKNNAYYRRGELYLEQNKLDLALADVNKAIADSPKNFVAYFLRGQVYAKQGKKTLARADFTTSMEASGLRKVAQIQIDMLDGKAAAKSEPAKPTQPATRPATPIRSSESPAPVWRSTSTDQIGSLADMLGFHSPKGLNLLCRAPFSGGVHPGIVLNKKCNIGYNGQEIAVSDFEVYLTTDNPKLELLAKDGEKYAIGKEANGTPLFLCYLNHQNWWLPGKVVNGNCNYTWQGKEYYSTKFLYGFLAPAKSAASVTTATPPATPAATTPEPIANFVVKPAPEPLESQFRKEMEFALTQQNPSWYRGVAFLNLAGALQKSGKPEKEVGELLGNKLLEIAYIDFYVVYEYILMNKNYNPPWSLTDKMLGSLTPEMRKKLRETSSLTVKNYLDKKPQPIITEIFKPGYGWGKTVSSNPAVPSSASTQNNDVAAAKNAADQAKTKLAALHVASGLIEKDPKLAIVHFRKALEVDPNYQPAKDGIAKIAADELIVKGDAFLQAKDFKSAFAEYNKAVETAPNHINTYWKRARASATAAVQDPNSVNKELLQSSLADFDTVVTMNSKFADGYFMRALVLFQLERWEPTLADLTKAISLDPNKAEYYDHRANVFRILGDDTKKMADIRRSNELRGVK